MGQTTARVLVDGRDVPEVTSFEYTSDVLQIAEQATFTVVCKDKKYRDALQLGQEVEFVMENPGVRGGAPTVRHRGNIIQRRARAEAGGFTIDVVTADKGWHLQNNAAPLWFRLQGRTYADIMDPAVFTVGRDGKRYYFLDPSWGLRGVYWGNAAIARRRLKLGLAVVKQQAQKAFDQLQLVQVEAGEIKVGVIYDPMRDELFAAARGEGRRSPRPSQASSVRWSSPIRSRGSTLPATAARCAAFARRCRRAPGVPR